MESLFESYSDAYMLVNINSPIINDVSLIQSYQQDCDMYDFQASKSNEIELKCFLNQNRNEKMVQAIKGQKMNQSVNYWKTQDAKKQAFVADMDAQFVYVPKKWI